jgi:hypothetical protein
LAEGLKATEAKAGDPVRLVAADYVRAGKLIVVAKGAPAGGRIVDVRPAGRVGRSAKMSIELEWVESVTGARVPLQAVHQAKGPGRTMVWERQMEKLYGARSSDSKGKADSMDPLDQAVRYTSATAAAPFVLLFGKGKDATVEPGALVRAYAEGDVTLDAARVEQAQVLFPRIPDAPATVTFIRPNDNQLLRPWLHCQGVKLAHLGRLRYFQVQLRPGRYTCYAKHAGPVEFEFEAGGEYFVRIRSIFSLRYAWELDLLDGAEGDELMALARPVQAKDTKAFGELLPKP